MKPIPIAAAKDIAQTYGYDQVIIIARKVGSDGGEHCTTYGADKAHCDIAARCGDFLKHKVMGWHREQPTAQRPVGSLCREYTGKNLKVEAYCPVHGGQT